MAVFLLATAVVWAGLGSDWVTMAITDGSAVVTAFAGAVLVLRAARLPGGNRSGWTLFGIAMLLWGLGEVLWTSYEVVREVDVPYPSVADIAYLGAVPFAVAGLLAFARGSGARFRARTILDGCLVSGSLLFITWALVLGPAWRTYAGDTWSHVVTIAYPMTDLVLAVLALVTVQWGRTSQRSSLYVIAAGLLVMAAADTAYTWISTYSTFSTTNPISMLWPAAYLLIAVAAVLRPGIDRRAVTRVEPAAAVLIPYIPLLGAIAVAAPRLLDGRPLGPFLTVNGIALVAIVLIRQALTAWDLRTTVGALNDREHELRRLALADPLTGLANRASFGASLEAATSAPDVDPAVIYIDLDGFKRVNDSFGHAAGDELLVEVSRRLAACAGPRMMLARLGGDEFVVLVEDGQDEATEVARLILQSFTQPFQLDGQSIPFQASIGIAAAPTGGSPDEAVRRADAAMYVAKTSGKGRAVTYPDDGVVPIIANPCAS